MDKVVVCLLVFVAMACIGCISSKNISKEIEYVVFDSLSDYLETRLPKTEMERKRAGIIVDAKLTARMYASRDSVVPNIVELGIVTHATTNELIEVFKNSDRYVRIGRVRYPVYIMYLENLFDSGEYSHRPSYCGPPISTLYEVVRVDFQRKRFYIE